MKSCSAFLVPGYRWISESALLLFGSLFLGIFAHIKFYLPFIPVPVAIAPQLVLVLGVILGKSRGAWLVLLYLIEGISGLPVFAGGGGIFYLMGPTAGYLLGYLPAVYLVGYLAERSDRRASSIFWSMMAGNGLILLLGWVHLSFLIGWKGAFLLGVVPFLLIDGIKTLLFHQLLFRKGDTILLPRDYL